MSGPEEINDAFLVFRKLYYFLFSYCSSTKSSTIGTRATGTYGVLVLVLVLVHQQRVLVQLISTTTTTTSSSSFYY